MAGIEAKIEELQERCRTDLKYLVTKVLGKPRWNDDLHGELVKMIDAPGDRKLILLPRGHQKSVTISQAWTIQQILKNPDIRVKLISATWTLSRDLLHEIKADLENSPLKDIFGPFMTPKCRWTTDVIDVAQRSKWTANPTISTGGIDSGKTGSHCDLLIFDDIVTPENTTTPEQINKVVAAFQDAMPLLDPGGKIVVIGTRYSMSDVYGQILEHESRSINGNFLENEEQRREWRNLLYRKHTV